MLELDPYSSQHLLAFCAAATVAGLVRGFAGFAGPATATLLLAPFFAPTSLLPKIVMLDVFAYPMLLRNLERQARWEISVPMAISTVLMIPAGVYTLQMAEPEMLKRGIYFARRGYMSLSLELSEDDDAALLTAFDDVLARFGDSLCG